ncbi:hypothetical protein TOPH_05462 [Tolypocladium ophioglossoides CBS 100239]|uniref:Uncharacterized protein n=1 Tax=Tolypocladium ophioglossoides (strain CBS 100239) TaxID=1163406 RepID=A0A0L0N7L4_TOLOC|nr:hypothetical protein TOPH_05462 [Tolypocladium ophioglossoides CBS 100239]
MACRGRCFSAADGIPGKPVVHEEASQLGLTWYFCPAHLGFHAMFLFDGAPQPFCGECAVLFFDKAHCAVWIRQYDLPAVMSNSAQVLDDARADMDAMLSEIDDARLDRREADPDPFAPPGELQAGVFREIPKHDWTYSSLSTTLFPHTRIPNMFLLEYRTFQGALAYQPCSKNIGISGIFKSLRPIDEHGDPIFKQARTWSCMVQAMQGLPRELRWVLATIYNFCNEMLRQDTDEDTLWKMRSWLLHWYTVTDELLELFGIFVYTPDIDWFDRPKSRSRTSAERSESLESYIMGWSDSDRSSGGGTVIRRRPGAGDGRDNGSRADAWPHHHHEHRVSAIHAWLASQPHLPDLDDTPSSVKKQQQQPQFVDLSVGTESAGSRL